MYVSNYQFGPICFNRILLGIYDSTEIINICIQFYFVKKKLYSIGWRRKQMDRLHLYRMKLIKQQTRLCIWEDNTVYVYFIEQCAYTYIKFSLSSCCFHHNRRMIIITSSVTEKSFIFSI